METQDKFGFGNLNVEEFNTIRQVLNNLFDISHWEDISTAWQKFSTNLPDKEFLKFAYVERNKIIPRSNDTAFLNQVRITGNFLKLSGQALLDEIAFFKPALMVNFGSLARDHMGYLTRNLKLKDVSFPNPAPTANPKGGLVLGKKNLTPENKSKYIIKGIKSKLRLPNTALLWNKSAPVINN